ncbi:MAG: alkaline phosphatase [Halanaerobiales bacterium]|nr:alkaline phosphatase [Halanaerobiales bacterium]
MCKMGFRRITVVVLALVLGLSLLTGVAGAKAPKYVFYFIGDGMGAAQRQAAEYYLRAQTGNEDLKLVMNQFPVAGVNTTHSADTLVTDSAAAGTALATGYKTNNGMISQLPDGTNVKTLFEAAEEKGMATGIVTTTRLTHATPAVFASHNRTRGAENEIAYDFLDSGVDFFAGGGYRHFVPQNWKWGKSKRKDDINVAQEFYEQGYNIFLTEYDTPKFRDYRPKGQEKVFAALTYSHMPYELDRDDTKVPSLAEMTAKAIEVLKKYDNGFILMVEGGRIDHACHANDPAGTIHDTLAFDKAIAEAYEFYKEHPDETLIVVVGDHETGGFGLGFGKNYFLKMDQLFDIKVTTADVLNYGAGKYDGNRSKFYSFIAVNLGLDDLTSEEKTKIERAMNIVDAGKKVKGYGGYDPVAITVTHIISERANMFWTTYAHSGSPVPLSAIGVGAEKLGGFKDNTEVARVLFSLLGLQPTKVASNQLDSLLMAAGN